MPRLVSWIRECDEAPFGRFFARRPDLDVRNARIEPADVAEAHGLLVTGGPDIAAEFLQQAVTDPAVIQDPDPVRDAWEFAAVRAALERGLPMLCICKGVQVLNVALGGTLHLDIPGHNLPAMKFEDVQSLRFAADARHRFARVNSSHHQALDRVADPLEVEAWHEGDGVIEQVRLKDYPWGVGVQYHPERGPVYAPLFDDFFAQLRPA